MKLSGRKSRMPWDRLFFASNALGAILILGLITLFLFVEAIGFFPGYRKDLQTYRNSGMEICDRIEAALEAGMDEVKGPRPSAVVPAVLRARLDELAPVRAELVSARELARQHREELESGRRKDSISLERDDAFGARIESLLSSPPFRDSFEEKTGIQARVERLPGKDNLNMPFGWPGEKVGWWPVVTTFFGGELWLTNSFQQDWYGVLPLLTGSLFIGGIAILVALPFGLAAAVYVNQLSRSWEKRILKPGLELIAAFPTIFLAFIGLLVWSPILDSLSASPLLAWLPFFPFEHSLNAFTAGTMLGFVAIPIIFTLSEDALQAVPREYLEGAIAMGATRSQTLSAISLPVAAPGIISGILLGFGRVVGETMIVMIIAGNRIELPTFNLHGILVFEPMHSMTGMIAQEMGEVGEGSLHYRALFLIATVLFGLTLSLNFAARTLARKVRLNSLGSMDD